VKEYIYQFGFFCIELYCEENQKTSRIGQNLSYLAFILFGKKDLENSQTGKKPSGLACTLLT